jgi:hypothetical protein
MSAPARSRSQILPLSALPFASPYARYSRGTSLRFRVTATIFAGNQTGKDCPSRPAGSLVPYGMLILARKCDPNASCDRRLPDKATVTCELSI